MLSLGKSEPQNTEVEKIMVRIAERQGREIAISPTGTFRFFTVLQKAKADYLCCFADSLFSVVDRLACSAFQAVFQRRQTRFTGLLAWLAEQKRAPALRAQAASLGVVVQRFSELI